VLGAEEDCGRALIAGLQDEQRATATIRTQAFSDILTGPGREDSLRDPAGLRLDAAGETSREIAARIVDQFLGAMSAPVAEAERAKLRQAGIGALHFAWAGGLEPRQPHYWRLHGPTLLIEYDNTQNDANHIHSVWHDPRGDFGADVLRRHYDHPSHGRGR
jgi:hypothetical protein